MTEIEKAAALAYDGVRAGTVRPDEFGKMSCIQAMRQRRPYETNDQLLARCAELSEEPPLSEKDASDLALLGLTEEEIVGDDDRSWCRCSCFP